MNKDELKTCLAAEKTLYLGEDKKRIRHMRFARHKRYCIWLALYDFRLAQYYSVRRSDQAVPRVKRVTAKFLFRWYDRKRNRSGAAAGVEIGIGSTVGRGVNIWHSGVVINGALGENCILHGNNVIGNKGSGLKAQTPVIGSGVDIGAGAVVIGNITIADSCTIGAGAVVTRSCGTPGAVLAGVPARIIGQKAERTDS